MDFLTALLARNGYLPHGYCFTWTPGLLWTMVGADAVIAAAYFSIPVAIVSFLRRRRDVLQFHHVAWLFSGFIFACGLTHLMDIWTIWKPDYALQTLVKVVTAAISIATAIALWPLIPKALRIPSVQRLQSVIASLEAEIDKRRAAESHLQDTQQNLAITLGTIGAGFIATDREGRVTRMNAVAERVTGWTQAEAEGTSFWQVFKREDRPAGYLNGNPVDLVLEQHIDVDSVRDMVALSRDGTRTHVEVRAAATRGDDGAVRGMGVVFRDIKRLVQAEAESSRLAAIVESSDDAIIGKSLDGRITSWNRAAETLFGWRADEAIGKPARVLVPPERAAEELRILDELARGGRVPAFDTQRVAKDGRLIDVSISMSPIRDAHGHIVGASKIARDVSAQRDAQRKAQRLEVENRQFQEANRLKSQFLANMSHELRTPLNAIIGFADLLHAGTVPTDSPKHQQFLGHIGTSGRHLLQLINDVLDLSKVESGKFEFFPEPVDLPQLVQEVEGVLHTAIVNKRLLLSTDIDESLGELVLDPARLKQVLYNYLSNAIKFTPDGGRVEVRARAEGPLNFRLEVEDSGIGIAEADQARLFVEFQQLDAGSTKQHQGTGLGLSLTRRLVQAQGGSVGVRSKPGVGSVFHLVLRRLHDVRRHATDDDDAAAGSPTTAAALPPLQRLLVIENDLPAQNRLVRGLSDAGFQVDAVADREQAMRQAGSRVYDAITLDLMLHDDQRGLDVLADIRSRGASRESPVVGVTMPTDADTWATFAVADVLCKPIRSEEIVSAMARIKPPLARRAKVMVIDDDPRALELMESALHSIGIDAVCVQDGRTALRDIDRHRPDGIILDLTMPQFDGFAVIDALGRMPAWQHTPVFIWTSLLLTDDEYASLARTARAIIGKGGGELTSMLDTLRRWRPPLPAPGQVG